MRRETRLALMRRLLPVVEQNWPEMADRYMQVPLDYYHDEALAAKEREIFETQPLALIAASEIARPHDFVVRSAVDRSILLTRDADGRPTPFSTTAVIAAPSPLPAVEASASSPAPTMAGTTIRRDASRAYLFAIDTRAWMFPSLGWSSYRAKSGTVSFGSFCGRSRESTWPAIWVSSMPNLQRSDAIR